MRVNKLLVLGLAIIATATLTTSCQDDDNWKPTWAMPLVKEVNLQMGEFVNEDEVHNFNAHIKNIWSNYVAEELDVPSGGGGPAVIDSIAYEIITNPNGGSSGDGNQYASYIEYTGPGGAPQLNQATKDSLLTRGNTQEQIDEINAFLIDYWNDHPELHTQSGGGANPTMLAKVFIRPKSGGSTNGSGAAAVDNLLNGIVGNSSDVFITAANLIDHMGSNYIDSINNEVDDILNKVNMNDLIDLDLRSMIKEKSQVFSIDLTMDIANDLPFDVNFLANFVDGNDGFVHNIFNATLTSSQEDKSNFNEQNEATLNNILDQTKKVKLEVLCTRRPDQNLTPPILRKLSEKGIKFSMRVKVQAQMSDILSGF